MARIDNRDVSRGDGVANVTLPTFRMSGLIIGDNNETIADHTGDNAVEFPACINALSNEQQDWLIAHVLSPVLPLLAAGIPLSDLPRVE